MSSVPSVSYHFTTSRINANDTTTKIRTADDFDNEFRYYSKIVQDLILCLSKQEDKETILPWIHKLSSPGYNVSKLRDKRNRYMLMLCISLLMDTIDGPFLMTPPEGILPDIKKIEKYRGESFEWEIDTTWEEQLRIIKEIENMDKDNEMPKYYKRSKCPVHTRNCFSETPQNAAIGKILDRQFQFLLWLCKPYAAMLLRSSDRFRAAKWIQSLCSIDRKYCAIAKGIRNDYMLALSGHLLYQDLTGVFEDYPLDRLYPLGTLAQLKLEKRPITDPTHPKAAEFFMNVPHPEEGAFAFIAVTGDLYEPKYK